MNFSDYINPVNLKKIFPDGLAENALLGTQININTDFKNISDLRRYDIAILGIEEDRNATVKGSAGSPYKIREKLYTLTRFTKNLKIFDLGIENPSSTEPD